MVAAQFLRNLMARVPVTVEMDRNEGRLSDGQ
jgi:hypothetical protein